MHPTRNDLPARNRARFEKVLLKDRLADAGTPDSFTAILRELDKYLWFLDAHVQAAR